MDYNSDGFQCLLGYTAYWWVHAINYWQGAHVKCEKHGMARSVTDAQSHDECRVEEVQQEFMGVHGFKVCSNA